VAFHAARLGEEGAPTSLSLVFTDAEGAPRGPPIDLLEPLALAPDPAALAAAPDGALVAAIVMEASGPSARVLHVPAPGATPPPPSATR
jgi:hypothetical protein